MCATHHFQDAAADAELHTTFADPYINSSAYSIPITEGHASDPLTSVEVGNDTIRVHVPAAIAIADGDTRMAAVLQGGFAYEFWHMRRAGPGTYSADRVERIDTSGDGRGGVRASGFSILGGLIRRDETKVIDHALVVALSDSQLKPGPVWPADSQDANAMSTYRGSIPIGSALAIPPNVDLSKLPLSPEGRALGKALQQYGAYVGDRSTHVTLYADPSISQSAIGAMRSDFKAYLWNLVRICAS